MCPLTLNTLSPARVNIFGTSRYSLFVLINIPLSLPLSLPLSIPLSIPLSLPPRLLS
jgi:hypothetical protein